MYVCVAQDTIKLLRRGSLSCPLQAIVVACCCDAEGVFYVKGVGCGLARAAAVFAECQLCTVEQLSHNCRDEQNLS